MDASPVRRSITVMVALVIGLLVVLGLMWVNRVHRRRRHTDDVHLMRHNAGVFGLGECPPQSRPSHGDCGAAHPASMVTAQTSPDAALRTTSRVHAPR